LTPPPSPTGDASSGGRVDDPAEPLLQRATRGDVEAARAMLPRIYGEMRRVAAGYLGRERQDHTLQPTALVHEAWLRLQHGERRWSDDVHLLAAAAITMRRVLVDHARQRRADKRDGGRKVRLETQHEVAAPDRREIELLELDALIERLRGFDARKARVVELRFFAGMTNEQIAAVLDVARSTVAEDWAVARAWLAGAMGGA